MDVSTDTDLSPDTRALFDAIADKNISLMKYLVEIVSNLDEVNEDGDTLLHVAVNYECMEAVALLVDKGANLEITNAQSDTAWQLACWNGYLDAVKFFVQRDKNQLYAVNCIGNTGLHLAANNGYTKIVAFFVLEDKKLLDRVNRLGNIPLHLACRNGHVKTVKFLVAQDIKQLDKVNLQGGTVLHAAVEWTGCLQTVSFLVQQHKKLLDVGNALSDTPLHVSASNGNKGLTAILMQLGAKFDVTNYCGMTPLLQAYRRNKKDVVCCILSFMPDVEVKKIVNWLGIRFVERIVSYFQKDLSLSDEVDSLLARFQRIGIVSTSGLLAPPPVVSNTVNHYTPSFSNGDQQGNNTRQDNMPNNPGISAENNKRPNNNK